MHVESPQETENLTRAENFSPFNTKNIYGDKINDKKKEFVKGIIY